MMTVIMLRNMLFIKRKLNDSLFWYYGSNYQRVATWGTHIDKFMYILNILYISYLYIYIILEVGKK